MRVLTVSVLVILLAVIQFAIVENWPADLEAQWAAVGSLSALVAGSIAAIGLVGLWFVRQQIRQGRQQSRVEVGPYLRVDLAPDVVGGTWQPPEADERYTFTYADFNPGEPEPRSPLDEWPSLDEPIDVWLWMSNHQRHPGGVAHNVEVLVELVIPQHSDVERPVQIEFRVQVHYIEPGRQIRYRIARVPREIPYARGRVMSLRYSDMYGNAMAFAHGSTNFEWSAPFLVNGRSVLLGGPEYVG